MWSGKKIVLILLLLLIVSCSPTAESRQDKQNNFFLQTSLLTHHWTDSSNQNNSQDLLGLEYHTSNELLYGGAYFQNSYSQPCLYFYTGKIYNFKQLLNIRPYGKLTYGIITGYDDEGGRYTAYWNQVGTFPAVIPSLGLQYNNISCEISLFADAGFIVNAGIKF